MIWLDSREKRSDGRRQSADDLATLISLFHARGLTTERKHLDFGDIAFEGHGPRGPVYIGIERKTISDFISSLHSGRLTNHQIPGMQRAYDHCYLIIQGITRRNFHTGLLERPGGHSRWYPITIGSRDIPYSSLDSGIWSMEQLGGMTVRRTASDAGSVEEVSGIYRSWLKRWSDHGSFKTVYLPPRPTAQVIHSPSVVRRFAAILPGIGWKRSGDVVSRFRSCKDIVEAGLDEWTEIPGIGRTTAQKAYRAIRGGDE